MKTLINICLAIAFILMLIAGIAGLFQLTLGYYFISFIVFVVVNILMTKVD